MMWTICTVLCITAINIFTKKIKISHFGIEPSLCRHRQISIFLVKHINGLYKAPYIGVWRSESKILERWTENKREISLYPLLFWEKDRSWVRVFTRFKRGSSSWLNFSTLLSRISYCKDYKISILYLVQFCQRTAPPPPPIVKLGLSCGDGITGASQTITPCFKMPFVWRSIIISPGCPLLAIRYPPKHC